MLEVCGNYTLGTFQLESRELCVKLLRGFGYFEYLVASKASGEYSDA